MVLIELKDQDMKKTKIIKKIQDTLPLQAQEYISKHEPHVLECINLNLKLLWRLQEPEEKKSFLQRVFHNINSYVDLVYSRSLELLIFRPSQAINSIYVRIYARWSLWNKRRNR